MGKDLVINGITYKGITGFEIPDTNGDDVLFIPNELPVPTNPAGEGDVRLGKEYLGPDGQIREGFLRLDGVYTPDMSAFVPIKVGNDVSNEERYLVMTTLDGVGGAGGNFKSFYVNFPSGETVRYFYDPSVCYDWNSFIASEYNTGRFEAGVNTEGDYCVMTKWDDYGYYWYIDETQQNLDAPIEEGKVYDCIYYVP